jgi:hypothetical protein
LSADDHPDLEGEKLSLLPTPHLGEIKHRSRPA